MSNALQKIFYPKKILPKTSNGVYAKDLKVVLYSYIREAQSSAEQWKLNLAMEFDYTLTTTKNFDSAVKSVEEEVARAGMQVLHIHDVQKTLVEKGFEREPFKIVEFCSAKYANDFLHADMKIGLCMPCKINVYIKDGKTFVSGMRPIILPQFFPKANLGARPYEIDRIVQNIINKVK